MRTLKLFVLLALATPLWTALVAGPVAVSGEISRWEEPNFDRWMYPFNSSPGFRGTAPTFSAVGTEGFDDFDGEFLIGFNLSGSSLAQAAANPDGRLLINSVTVTATHSTGGFIYDPTFDLYESHLPASDPAFVADSDAGRPVELYGARLRNGYQFFSFAPSTPENIGPPAFEEGELYALGNPVAENARSAYAFDPEFGSVSNVVTDRLFGARPWAIGQTDVAPGSSVATAVAGVSPGSTFRFALDLARADVLDYVTAALTTGRLFFTLVSLHPAAQQSGGANPNYYTRDNFDAAAIAPTLEIDWALVPNLIGDANGDCEVGAADYALWAAQFGQTGTGLSADFDGNGEVGAGDYALWAANFGKTCETAQGASVPEPATLWLLTAAAACGGLGLSRRGKGRR